MESASSWVKRGRHRAAGQLLFLSWRQLGDHVGRLLWHAVYCWTLQLSACTAAPEDLPPSRIEHVAFW